MLLNPFSMPQRLQPTRSTNEHLSLVLSPILITVSAIGRIVEGYVDGLLLEFPVVVGITWLLANPIIEAWQRLVPEGGFKWWQWITVGVAYVAASLSLTFLGAILETLAARGTNS